MADWNKLAQNAGNTAMEGLNWLKEKINPLLAWIGEQLSKLPETIGNLFNHGTKAAQEALPEVQKTVANLPEKLGNSAANTAKSVQNTISTIMPQDVATNITASKDRDRGIG